MQFKFKNDKISKQKNQISNELKDLINEFNKQYDNYIIKTPKTPLKDSKGKHINEKGYETYIKLIREHDNNPTVMISKDGSASKAFLYSNYEKKWKKRPDMWQEFFYEGVAGLDYIYIDDLELKSIIKSYDQKSSQIELKGV